MSRTTFIITGICLLLFLGLTVDGAVLSGTDLSLASTSSSGSVELSLDEATTGLAGYQFEISLSPDGIAEITTVNFPAAFSMNSASSLPSSSVSIVAVDLMDQITAGATDILLATLGIQGLSEGETDMQISITELTDDSGDPISATVTSSHITVGSTEPTVTPTATPTQTPTSEPTAVPTTVPPTTEPTVTPTITPTATPTSEPTQMPTQDPGELQAAFTAMPMTGIPPLTVNFTDHSTGSPEEWRWDFGDGTLSTVQNPTHVYGGIGRYTVTLEVIHDNFSSIERRPEIIRVVGDYPLGPSGFVMVTSDPSGAEVYMEDLYLGTTPATLIVPAGSRSLSFSMAGYQKKTVNVTIRPHETKLIPKVILREIL